MNNERRFYFIINPISGGRSKASAVEHISEVMNEHQIQYEFGWWEKEVRVKDLVEDAITKGYDTLVAVGGDGTINQVASEIVNTDLVLGVIPFGSGNGFARHLGIKGTVQEQTLLLLNSHIQNIDTGTCNGNFFINISGVGFDAHVSHRFSKTEGRGMANYAKVSLIEARTYPEEVFELCLDGETMTETAFLISIANGSQWGNEFKIAPDAKLNDGLLQCCLLKKPPLLAIPGLIRRFLTGDIAESKFYKDIPFKQLTIKRKHEGAVHLDGEPIWLKEELEFKINPLSLRVIVS